MDKHLRFEVGEYVEARSFKPGYRGAWFRCKIKDISRRKTLGLGYVLEYCDFPDEKLHWTKLYQKPQFGRGKELERQLMVRPCFPPIYRESQLPDVNTITSVTVAASDVWKVGSLVDLWADGCYWSGRLTKALGNEKFMVELLPLPLGEGSSYEAYGNDLRPSLDWSPEDGWTTPISMGSESCHSCARLIKPMNQGSSSNLMVHCAGHESRNEVQKRVTASFQNFVPFPRHILSGSLSPLTMNATKETKTQEINKNLDMRDCSIGKTSYSDGVSSFHVRNAFTGVARSPGGKHGRHDSGMYSSKSEQMLNQPLTSTSKETQAPDTNMEFNRRVRDIGKPSCSDSVSNLNARNTNVDDVDTGGKDVYDDIDPSKKMRSGESMSLNTMCSDTEAAILDLEELVNRIKWIKGILEFGTPMSNAMRPTWKFLEHRASSTPK